ncbi:MAG TPA: redoxin domain-containing protein [Polyangia bacterium]|jgi:peroxiredoxin|nr:redoxin domain-containing protein [Polyangia bacterium]
MPSYRSLGLIGLLFAGVAHAQASPPWLGVELQSGPQGGVVVKRVIPHSPAGRAGIRVGEEVVEFAGQKVTSGDALVMAVQHTPAGTRVPVKLARGRGSSRTVELVVEPRPDLDTLQRDTLLDQSAPDFMPKVVAGGKLGRLSSLRGRVVLLDFFATWCGPCRASMPHITALHRRLASRGLQVIGISNEEPQVVAGAAERFQLDYPLAADPGSEIGAQYFIHALPTVVLIDKRGQVRHIGGAGIARVEQVVTELLDEK